jgi:HB1, ASXL, restriction endonuclease HTH domain
VSGLDDALERSRELIGQALAAARAELETVDARRAELVAQIERAEAMVGGGGAAKVSQAELAPLTLHEALVRVLEDHGNEWMSAREMANEVNRRGLYRKRDGSAVEVNQVHARANNHPELFEKDGSKIRLKEGATVTTTITPNVVMFKDDDDGFFEWQEAHPDGLFINTERKPNPNYLVLHNSGCGHFKGDESVHWTRDYVKACSDDRNALEEWAREVVGGDVTLCGSCFR